MSEIDELKTLLQQTVQAKQTEQASMSLEVEELKRKMEVPHANFCPAVDHAVIYGYVSRVWTRNARFCNAPTRMS